MRRPLMLAAAAVAVGFLPALVLSIGPSPDTRTAACVVSTKRDHLPDAGASFQAGSAGRVVLATAPGRSLAVTSVVATSPYRAIVDKARGSSVKVYFGANDAQVEFGAAAAGDGLQVRVTTCS